jgi:multidrug efflux pump subunit AcrA (membrane-fusion protein)
MMKISKMRIKIKNFKFCIVTLIFALCILNFLAGCGKKTAKVKEGGIPVEAARVQEKQLQEILKFTGDIEGKDQIQVYPKVPGKLIEYKVQEGEPIKKQDVIALIDRDVTGFKFEPAPVEAPISGIVAKTYLDRGDSVSPQVPIAVVADMDEVKVKIEITEVDYPKVKLGQTAEIKVDAYPNKEFEGKLSKLSTLIDPNTRTAQAEITIPNSEHLLVPGMFARISLFVGERKTLVMSLDALLRMPGTGSYYCFKVENERAKKVFLKIGIIQDNLVEVKEGLKQGDLVIVSGQGALEEGSKLAISKFQ